MRGQPFFFFIFFIFFSRYVGVRHPKKARSRWTEGKTNLVLLSQFILMVLMMILRKPQRLQMLLCSREHNIKILHVGVPAEVIPQSFGFLGRLGDMNLLPIGMKEVPEHFSRAVTGLVWRSGVDSVRIGDSREGLTFDVDARHCPCPNGYGVCGGLCSVGP
jgi:hypothetical protein